MENVINEILSLGQSIKPLSTILDRQSLYIYGAGNFGKDIYRALLNRGISVNGFIDQNAHKDSSWNNTIIYHPDDDRLSGNLRENFNVMLAIHNRDVDLMPVILKLKQLGYHHIVTPIELYDYFGQELGNRFWLTSRSTYLSWKAEINQGFSLWEDEPSRQLYFSTLAFRLSGDYSHLAMPDQENQYFPPDLPVWKQPLRFVDCGAFDGDTLMSLKLHHIQVEAIAAFEPEPINFSKLSSYVKDFPARDICLWPCAVYSSTSPLKFSGSGEAGKLNDSQGVTVQGVGLDEVIPNFQPNLIKMDIEGAEYDALLGARQIIKKYHPDLAICVYHCPDHLWKIPLLIKSWDLGYRFYLRSHAYSGFDMVLYAICDRIN
jgi:FkbM family methyltransferase